MKKWTYLVAAGMLLGATPVFTGCIDNDEPAGITELRGAKAELIRAKVAVEAANAARIQAEAAYIKAQEELVAAQAEIKKARAEKIRKEAELLAAKNEAEIAKIQAEINLLNQQAKEAEQRAQLLIQQIEAAIQAAEDAHNIALQKLAEAKASATEAQWQALAPWRNAYEQASEDYFIKTKAVLTAENELAKAQADKEVSVADRRAAERQLLMAQNDYENAKAALDKLNQRLTDTDKLEPGAIPAEIEKLETQIKEKEQAIAKVQVKKEEAKRDNPAYAELATLEKAKDDALTAEIAIEELKNTIDPDVVTYWQYEMDYEVVKSGAFSLNNLNEYHNAYWNLLNYKSSALKYQLDPDDVKWNEALINERTTELEAIKKDFKEIEDLFIAAVNAYNEGKGVDVTAYIGYDKLVEAVKLYNDESDKYGAQKEIVDAKEKLYIAAVEEYQKAANDEHLYKYWSIYDAAKEKAGIDKQDAINKAGEAFDAVMIPLFKKWQDAQALLAQREKEQALAEANLSADPNNEVLKNAVEAAKKKTAEAKKAEEGAETAYNTAFNTESPKLQSAIRIAKAQEELDLQLALNNYEKAQRDWETDTDPNFVKTLEGLAKTRNDAQKAWQAEKDKLDGTQVYQATWAMWDAAQAIDITKTRYFDRNSLSTELDNILDNDYAYDLDISKVFVVTDAKGYLISCSEKAYGGLMEDIINDSEWPGNRITPLDKAGVDKIIATYYPLVPKRYYPNFYSNFRALGNVLLKEVEIEKGKAYIANSGTFEALIKDIDTALAALETSLEKQEDVAEEAYDAYNLQVEVVAEIEKEFDLEEGTLTSEMGLLQNILAAYKDVPLGKDESYTAESIEKLKERLKAKIKTQELTVFDKETIIKIYEDKVEKLGQPDATEVDAKEFDLEIAKLEQERSADLLKKAEEELNAAIALIMGE